MRNFFSLSIGLLFVTAVLLISWAALLKIEVGTKDYTHKALQTVLHTNQEATHLWIEHRHKEIGKNVSSPQLIRLTEQLLEIPRNYDSLVASPLQSEIRSLLRPTLQEYGDLGFFIISPDLINLSSLRDANIGQRNLIAEQRGELLGRVFSGDQQFIPTIESDVPLPTPGGGQQDKLPTLFMAAPIYNLKGEIIAAFTQRLDPALNFNRIAKLGRLGETGETYAFDRNGVLLTESRFDHHLRQAGLIGTVAQGILSIRIVDPGGNLLNGFRSDQPYENLPLTLMAASATKGLDGYDVTGYRDYRGVTVFGVWLWDEALGIGMTTEVDAAEAMQPYYEVRKVLVLVLVATVLLAFTLSIFMILIRRRAEQQLQRAYSTLEVLVEERTRDLELAKDGAEEANQAKSDFLANMSHELRTPLNAVVGFSEVLVDQLFGPLNEKQQGYIENILTSGRHLLGLIDDILDLSKVEAGKMELELGCFPLKEILNSSLALLREKALKHNINLSLELEPEADVEIEADQRKCKQMMFNLLSNALKFTPDGGSVAVQARKVLATETQAGGDCVEISVADTGIGIKPEDMPKLFKEFSQLESPHAKQYEGTGLGLALTRKFVELHGGRIWAESEFGKGSRFSFALPLRHPVGKTD